MKSKLFLLTATLLVLGFAASAQTASTSFGVRAGLDFQTFSGKDHAGEQLKLDLTSRFHIGVLSDILIATDFYFQPGLLFTTKGAKSQEGFLGMDMAAAYKLSYIELPLSLLYKPVLGNGRFILGFGPYLAYGFSGKVKYTVNTISSEEDVVFGNEYDSANPNDMKYFKSLDYGGNLFFGYELPSGITMQLNTQLGLAKINADNNLATDGKTLFKNTGFGLSLGYSF